MIINERARRSIRNVIRVAGAHISRIATTFVLTLLLPKLLSEEEYGYWQLYLFYCSYLCYSSLGFSEGTMLKYAGENYRELDGRSLSSQFWSLAVYEALFVVVAFFLANVMLGGSRTFLAIASALAYILPQVLRSHLQIILQATRRISEYARCYTGERLLYFALVIVFLLLGKRDFRYFAGAETISVTLTLIYAAFLCREVTFKKPLPLRESFSLTRELICSGIKIMLAGIAGQLIVGIVRFAIEEHWGTVVFGKISLSLSMANMLITCISAVGIVLYPTLSRANRKKLFDSYLPARTCLAAVMYGLMLFYIPVKIILGLWLPRYAESLHYLAILFPLCIYETRTSILAWTYLKTLRRERDILKANVSIVLLSALTTFVTVHILGSLNLAVLSIIALYAAKAIYTEVLLARHMPLHIGWNHLLEAVLTITFIACNWMLSNGMAFVIYLTAYLLYLCVIRKNLVQSFAFLRELVSERKVGA